MILMFGPPAAGKSWVLKKYCNEEQIDLDKFVKLDPDELRYFAKDFVDHISGVTNKAISGRGRNSKQFTNPVTKKKTRGFTSGSRGDRRFNALKNTTVASLAAVRGAIQGTNGFIEKVAQNRYNFIYDSACMDIHFCCGIAKDMLRKGYHVHLVGVQTDFETIKKRNHTRMGKEGRFISDDDLNRMYESATRTRFDALCTCIKEIDKQAVCTLYDNNGTKPKRIIA